MGPVRRGLFFRYRMDETKCYRALVSGVACSNAYLGMLHTEPLDACLNAFCILTPARTTNEYDAMAVHGQS